MVLKSIVREFYERDTSRALAFRYALFSFDIGTIVFLIISSFLPRTPTIGVLDVFIGLIILADLVARFWISTNRAADFMTPANLADIVVVVSLLAPFTGE